MMEVKNLNDAINIIIQNSVEYVFNHDNHGFIEDGLSESINLLMNNSTIMDMWVKSHRSVPLRFAGISVCKSNINIKLCYHLEISNDLNLYMYNIRLIVNNDIYHLDDSRLIQDKNLNLYNFIINKIPLLYRVLSHLEVI